ncbi:MAG: PhoH family protein [Puniceicoccaceae bacterium]|nr:MAG: PhoH family protein [Puniceicoccaceae bacterium]
MVEKKLFFPNPRHLNQLYCGREENLQLAESRLGLTLVSREDWLALQGPEDAVGRGKAFFTLLDEARSQGLVLKSADFRRLLDQVAAGHTEAIRALFERPVVIQTGRRTIVPKTLGQKRYLEAVRAHDIVFGIGPAGTGKTYLAVAVALAELLANRIEKIILARPAVEAGEALGFLPGDLREKILPYLRPLYDAMYDMLDKEDVVRLIDRGIIEIAPLAYMRGRTLSNAFVILDEAQNATAEQMMMFLTRLGDNSRMVVTGDVTQIDLPRSRASGLVEAARILRGIPEIAFHYFDGSDVVRHPLVQKIIEAYQAHREAAPDGTSRA